MEEVYILTYRGVNSEFAVGWGATARSLPDRMASMHLRFATLLTAWTKAGCRNTSKLLWSVICCRELICREDGYIRCGVIPAFYTYISAISVESKGFHTSRFEREFRKAEHDDPARLWGHVPRFCLDERLTAWLADPLNFQITVLLKMKQQSRDWYGLEKAVYHASEKLNILFIPSPPRLNSCLRVRLGYHGPSSSMTEYFNCYKEWN